MLRRACYNIVQEFKDIVAVAGGHRGTYAHVRGKVGAHQLGSRYSRSGLGGLDSCGRSSELPSETRLRMSGLHRR